MQIVWRRHMHMSERSVDTKIPEGRLYEPDIIYQTANQLKCDISFNI